jgi:hypothetical protein
MHATELQIRKDDISKTRIVEKNLPPLADGEILVKVESFALTANNVTYAVVGERIGYWKFFPAEGGWGVVPVWGFADVVETKCADVKKGERLYGYFPMGTHVVMRPGKVSPERLIDASSHRAELPPVYNSYARLSGEPWNDQSMNDERSLLFPLYATSFCLYDFLKDNNWFGADQIVVGSASSKTAIGLAYALNADPSAPRSVGLTSRGNAARVQALQLYGDVATYDAIDRIAKKPTVIVDMSGDGKSLTALHAHLGDDMRYCSNVGVTHYDKTERGPGFIAERSAMFFAPGHIKKRADDWGPGTFERKAYEFWRQAATKSRAWLKFEPVQGLGALQFAYQRVREGNTSPESGIIARI